MWIVGNKPGLSDALTDIDPLVDHCNNLNDAHKQLLIKLYRQYHSKGYANSGELGPLSMVKGVIKGQYSKMYGNGTMGYIRYDLLRSVPSCPMCSINESAQLDHFMHKEKYGQLACCRLNLVPTCGRCNRLKYEGEYTDFVHAYYDKFPNADFLITTITVKNNNLGMVFQIDHSVFDDKDLARRTQNQFQKLDLLVRLRKAGTTFLNDIIESWTCSTERQLQEILRNEEERNMQTYGRNDWRTSIIRGLRANQNFNIDVVNARRKRKIPHNVNGGGA